MIDAAVSPQFFAAHETDVTNNGPDCVIGQRSCYAFYVSGTPVNPGTAAFSNAPQGSNPGWHIGFLNNGPGASDRAGFDDESKAAVGYDSGSFGGSTRATAAFRDQSTTPVGLKLGGTYATAAIQAPGFAVGTDGDDLWRRPADRCDRAAGDQRRHQLHT